MHTFSKPNPLSFSVAAAVALLAVDATDAFAQRAQQIEEVVITAERREATEQTTAISMEVFTGENLAEQDIVNLADLQNAMPGIQIQEGGLGNNINIRGIGSAGGGPTVMQGVAVVRDGHAHGEPRGTNGSFFDVGTMEVLRGPQGTFVGQASTGGAILVNSARPNFDGVNGYIEGTVGNFERRKLNGAVNLPISDTLAGRVAFNSDARDSFYTNQGGLLTFDSPENFSPGAYQSTGYRLSLLWQPTSALEATFIVEESKLTNPYGYATKPNPRPVTSYADTDNDPSTAPVAVTTYSQFLNYAPTDPFTINPNEYGVQIESSQQWTAQVVYEFVNGMSMTNKLSLSTLSNIQTAEDSDGTYLDRGVGTQTSQRGEVGDGTFNYDITLASPDTGNNWIIGATWGKRKPHNTRVDNVLAAPLENCGWQSDGTHIDCLNTPAPEIIAQRFHAHSPEVIAAGIFGQYNYQLTDQLELTAGARVSYDYNRYERAFYLGSDGEIGDTLSAFGSTVVLDTPCSAYGAYYPVGWNCAYSNTLVNDTKDEGLEDTVPTWKIGLNWTPSDNQFLYAFYARGYKAAAAGFSGNVDPEYVDDYEFGWKGALFDGMLSADVGYYYMDYKDFQDSVFFATNPAGSGSDAANIPGSTIQGVEGSFRAFIGDNLSINGTIALSKGEVGSLTTVDTASLPAWAELFGATGGNEFAYLPQCGLTAALNDPATATNVGNCFDFGSYFINLTGSEQRNNPELSYNLGIDYLIPLAAGGTLTPALSYSYTAESWTSLIQRDEYYQNDERSLLNGSLTYENDSWTVQAFINNLTDETYISSAGGSVRYGDPRTYGVRARMNF